MEYKLTDAHRAAIEAALAKNRRIELIPTRDGVKVVQINRKSVDLPLEPIAKTGDL